MIEVNDEKLKLKSEVCCLEWFYDAQQLLLKKSCLSQQLIMP